MSYELLRAIDKFVYKRTEKFVTINVSARSIFIEKLIWKRENEGVKYVLNDIER